MRDLRSRRRFWAELAMARASSHQLGPRCSLSPRHPPRAKSSSTSTSCSAARLYIAVTLYRLVILLVSLRPPVPEPEPPLSPLMREGSWCVEYEWSDGEGEGGGCARAISCVGRGEE